MGCVTKTRLTSEREEKGPLERRPLESGNIGLWCNVQCLVEQKGRKTPLTLCRCRRKPPGRIFAPKSSGVYIIIFFLFSVLGLLSAE